ncbi:MAG: MFS transporter, partial [Streptomyces sp.]|nr:MFS transporter [Streptomyces sp.]NUS81130.1 MFS transporter [Streptomyces sp.]
ASEAEAVADSYAAAQLDGLKAAILATGGIALASFLVTPHLPAARESRPRRQDIDAPAEATGSTH